MHAKRPSQVQSWWVVRLITVLWPRGNSRVSGRTNQMTNPELFLAWWELIWPLFWTVSCCWDAFGAHSPMQTSFSVMELMKMPWKHQRRHIVFSVEEKEAKKVQDHPDRRLLLIKNAGLQHLSDELLYMVFLAFQLCLLCVLEVNQKSAPVWDVDSGFCWEWCASGYMDWQGPKRGQFVIGVPLFTDGCCRQTADKCDFLRSRFQLAIARLLDVSCMIN